MREKEFEAEFIAFRSQLTSYLYRLSANKQDAEDITQDTFLKATEKLDQFKEKSSLKTWVFSIATNLARDNQRVKNRWVLDAQDACKKAAQDSSEVEQRIIGAFINQTSKTFDIKEHINYCFTCLGKNLDLEHQLVVILKEVYQFKRSEIAEIIGKTEGVVKHLLFDGRKELQERYNNRCAMINKKGVCYQCAELNDVLQTAVNGPLDAEDKIRSFGFQPMSDVQNLDTRFKIIRKINPLEGNGADLEDTILQILRETIHDN